MARPAPSTVTGEEHLHAEREPAGERHEWWLGRIVAMSGATGNHELYPDVSMVCGERRFYDDARDVLTTRAVVFEVLCDGTRSFDLGAKFREYQRLESLPQYGPVEQDAWAVACYRRAADGQWLYESLTGAGDNLRLSVGSRIALPLAQVYEGVLLAPGEASDE